MTETVKHRFGNLAKAEKITGSYQFPEQTYRWTESKGVAL